jgi:Asp/Glu/hydantoin racemase
MNMAKKKKLYLLHTVQNFMDVTHKPYALPFLEENPDVEIQNMLDTSLLADTVAHGSVPASVSSRILSYILGAEESGADMLLLTCTSVDAGMKFVKEFTDLPTLCISQPMVEAALDLGNRIGLVGTIPTSPDSIITPLRAAAEDRGMNPDDLQFSVEVANGAFEARMSGDDATHDGLVSEALMKLAKENELDAICFAQASMSAAVHDDPGIPVLKLGQSAFDAAAKMLAEL